MRTLRLGLATLSMLLVAAVPASASDDLAPLDPDESHSLDSVDRGTSRSLDAVDRGESQPLEDVDRGTTTGLDAADDARSESLDAADRGRSESLDAVDDAASGTVGEVQADDRPWSPSTCRPGAANRDAMPKGASAAEWSVALERAKRDVEQATRRLQAADAAYSRSINYHVDQGEERARIVAERDAARAEYQRARCALPEFVRAAQRARAPQYVWGPYVSSGPGAIGP